MGTFSWQTWNSSPFNIERKKGKAPGTVILRFSGPFTLRDAYSSLPTLTLKSMLDLETAPGEEQPTRNILDLTACPYMDSSGVGMIVTHYIRCKKKGIKLIAAGLSPKIRDVFRITKVDGLFPMIATIDEADIG
jgi:anti-anti-sigma factor